MIVFVGWFWDDSLKILFDGNGWLGNTKNFPTNDFTRFWNQQDDVFQFIFWMFFSVMILGMIYFFKRWFFRDYVPFFGGVDALKTTEERKKKTGRILPNWILVVYVISNHPVIWKSPPDGSWVFSTRKPPKVSATTGDLQKSYWPVGR